MVTIIILSQENAKCSMVQYTNRMFVDLTDTMLYTFGWPYCETFYVHAPLFHWHTTQLCDKKGRYKFYRFKRSKNIWNIPTYHHVFPHVYNI